LESPIEESDWAKIAVLVGGAGATDQVATQVQKVVPQLGVEMAGAGAGVLCYLYGERLHPLVKWAGIGLIAGSLMPRVKQWLGGIAPAAAPAAGTGVPKTAASAAAQAYIAGKR